MVTENPEIKQAIKNPNKFIVFNKNIDDKEPNSRDNRKVQHDTKINLNNKLGLDSILPRPNLYTNEAMPHVNKASNVKIYPTNSAINLKLFSIALKLF